MMQARCIVTCVLVCIVAAAAGSVTGCASAPGRGPGQTTALTVSDIDEVTASIIEQLVEKPVFQDRTEQTPELLITFANAINLSDDLIPDRQRWYLMLRVADAFTATAFAKQRNIVMIIPAERLRRLQRTVWTAQPVGDDRLPTHIITAEINNLQRGDARTRTDQYIFRFIVSELQTGTVLASARVQITRQAFGKIWY